MSTSVPTQRIPSSTNDAIIKESAIVSVADQKISHVIKKIDTLDAHEVNKYMNDIPNVVGELMLIPVDARDLTAIHDADDFGQYRWHMDVVLAETRAISGNFIINIDVMDSCYIKIFRYDEALNFPVYQSCGDADGDPFRPRCRSDFPK